MQELDYSGVDRDPLPHWLVTQNLLSLTVRVEQLEMDVKRLEGVIISWSEERSKKSYREGWKACVKRFSPPGSYR